MSKEQLDRARALIIEGQLDKAREILAPLANVSTTAQRWLAHLDDLAADENETETAVEVSSAPDDDAQTSTEAAVMEEVDAEIFAEPEPPATDAGDDDSMLPVPPEAPAATMPATDDEDETPISSDITGAAPAIDPEPRPVPDEMYIPADVDAEVSDSPPDEDEIPIDETRDVLPVDDNGVPPAVRGQWEYREIVLKNWQQHISNIEYALEQGGEKITIEDAYTRLLNEHGAQGWEVISEEVLPQQYIRLLMKRPARS